MDYLPTVTVEPAHVPLDVLDLRACSAPRSSSALSDPEAIWAGEDSISTASEQQLLSLAANLQQDLFFGLITGTSQDDLLMNASSQNSVASGWPVLSMATLASSLQYTSTERLSGPMVGLLPSLESQLEIAATHVQRILRKIEVDCDGQWDSAILRPLFTVLTSIQALIETIWDAQFAPRPPKDLTPSSNPFFFDNGFVASLMTTSGWPSSEMINLPKNIRLRYYLSFFKWWTAKKQRRTSFRQTPISKECYLAQHRSEGCKCPSLSPAEYDDMDTSFSIASMVGNPEDPRLRMTRVSLSNPIGRPPFVAFSHVRSDGLGSSTTNSLPRCQLLRLQELSNELLPNSPRPTPFYIDTLSVPLAGALKRRALRDIQDIFRIADQVLVLDSKLRRTHLGKAQENLIRIRGSAWAERLWTVQECAVARNVSFHFHGDNLPLHALLQSLEADDQYALVQTQILKDRDVRGFTDSEYECLAIALGLLSDDLQLAESLQLAAEPEFSPWKNYDKPRLRTILRLGLLALPHMRYFPEAYESVQFQTVASGVLAAYEGVDTDRERRSEAAHRDPAALYARLGNIQQIGLIETIDTPQSETIE